LPDTVSQIVLRIFGVACALDTVSGVLPVCEADTKTGGLVSHRTGIDGDLMSGGDELRRYAT
jgi:hypothetical protein